MEDEMFDTHLCLVCNQTILGLLNYVMHKRNQCPGKKQMATEGGPPPAPTPGPLPPPEALQSYQAPLTSLSSSHLQQPSPPTLAVNHHDHRVVSSSSMLPEFHHQTFTQSLRSDSESTFTSPTSSALSTPNVVGSGCYSDFQSPVGQTGHLFHGMQQGNGLPSTTSQDTLAGSMPSGMSADSMTSPVMVLPPIQSPMSSASLQDNHAANQNSCSGLSLDMHSPLSHFISANLSPIAGAAVDPNTVMPTKPGTCEDFFQCLELKSKGAQEQKSPNEFTRHSKQFEDDDHTDIDLPISKILSNLDFSSDEDIGDLPSDDDVDCDFDVYSDGDFEGPPKSHTGGKWKPGEGPQGRSQGKKLKWRLGAGPIRHGGKWKPGMSHGKQGLSSKGKRRPASKWKQQTVSIGKQSDSKVYECKLCDMTFSNRYLYSNHYGSKSHKEKTTARTTKIKTDKEDDKENTTKRIKNVEMCAVDEKDNRRKLVFNQNKVVHVCTVCDMKFKRKYEVAKHLVTNYHRNRCSSSPETINMLQKYYKLVLRLSPFQCQMCRFYFNRRTDFLAHVGTADHRSRCDNAVGQLMCVSCRFFTHCPEQLELHLASPEHSAKLRDGPRLCVVKEHLNEMKCRYCGIVVASRGRMKRHMAYRHHQKKVVKPYVRMKGGNHPDCPDCGKICLSPSALLIHVRRNHTKERPFHCQPCGKSFAILSALSSHIKSRRHENKLRQDAAIDVLDKAVKMTLHEELKKIGMKRSNGDDGNEDEGQIGVSEFGNGIGKIDARSDVESDGAGVDDVDETDHTFSTHKWYNGSQTTKVVIKREKKSVMKAVNRIKRRKVFKCEHCDFDCSKYDGLKPHCDEFHPREITQCDLCSSTFLSQKAYRIHCSGRYHQDRMVQSSETEASKAFHKCSICDMKFMDIRWRNFHLEYQHNHLNNEASLREINQGQDKVSQMYGEHLQLLQDLPKETSLACPECGKFIKKDYLVEHLRLHTGEKPFRCRFCEKSFVAKLSLRRHLMIHMGLTENTCDICGRDFKKLETYRIHMEQHNSEERGSKCICDVCGMVFTLQRQVEAHMKRHGERKFKCPVDACTWTFVLKHELKMHMLSHTKEKKFLCDICGFAATTKNRLQRHVKTHSGIRDHHCMYCPYKAGNSTHLRRHMRIHIGSKPFKCPYCPYTCNTHENVRKHIAKTKKHQGMKIYPCRFCKFGTNVGQEFRDHLLLCHTEQMAGEKLDSLSVLSGLYVRGEDPVEPQEGTLIVPAKERPQKVRKNLLTKNSKNNHRKGPSSAVSELVDCPPHRQVVNQPICNVQPYWPNDPGDNRNSWFPASQAVNTLSGLTADTPQLYAQPVSTSENCFLMNMPQAAVSTANNYYEGTVSNVVVVSSDY